MPKQPKKLDKFIEKKVKEFIDKTSDFKSGELKASILDNWFIQTIKDAWNHNN
jgi:hypothetical protein